MEEVPIGSRCELLHRQSSAVGLGDGKQMQSQPHINTHNSRRPLGASDSDLIEALTALFDEFIVSLGRAEPLEVPLGRGALGVHHVRVVGPRRRQREPHRAGRPGRRREAPRAAGAAGAHASLQEAPEALTAPFRQRQALQRIPQNKPFFWCGKCERKGETFLAKPAAFSFCSFCMVSSLCLAGLPFFLAH